MNPIRWWLSHTKPHIPEDSEQAGLCEILTSPVLGPRGSACSLGHDHELKRGKLSTLWGNLPAWE